MAWQKFSAFVEDLAEAKHNLGTDTLKMALTNDQPIAADAVLADIDQIAATGGYAPATVTITNSSQSGGVYTLAHEAVTFTATGAAFAPFRWVVFYNDTAAGKPLIAWLDYGISYTLPNGQPFTINANTILDLA